jgi:beta-lactamase class A
MTPSGHRSAISLSVTCLLAALLVPAARAKPAWPISLQAEVTREARGFDGEIAVYVKELSTGIRYTHNAATPVYLASGIKIMVLITVFEEISTGRLQWAEQLGFGKEDIRDGAYKLLPKQVGMRFSVKQLVGWMMEKSDNAATDLLIKRVGIQTINATVQKYGGPEFCWITSILDVRRNIYEQIDQRAVGLTNLQIAELAKKRPLSRRARHLGKLIGKKNKKYTSRDLWKAFRAYYDSGLNSAPLDAVGKLLESIERGEVVSPKASRQMIEIMKRCQTGKRRIRAGLPDKVVLAHKTGTQLKRICDLGILYLPDEQPVVFAICLKEFSSRRKAEALVSRLAKKTADLLLPLHPEPEPTE